MAAAQVKLEQAKKMTPEEREKEITGIAAIRMFFGEIDDPKLTYGDGPIPVKLNPELKDLSKDDREELGQACKEWLVKNL